MHQEKYSLTIGYDADGVLCSVRDVQSGARCGLTCPECKEALVARKGNILRHHLAHRPDSSCEASNESALHKFAKDLFSKQRILPVARAKLSHKEYSNVLKEEFTYNYSYPVFKNDEMTFDDSRVEHRMYTKDGDCIVADVAFFIDGKEALLIEVKCSHAVDATKQIKAKKLGIPMLEVTMPRISLEEVIEADGDWKAEIKKIILSGERAWLVHTPQYLYARNKLEQHYHELLNQEEQKVLAERAETAKRTAEISRVRQEHEYSNRRLIDESKAALRNILTTHKLFYPILLLEIKQRVDCLKITIHPTGRDDAEMLLELRRMKGEYWSATLSGLCQPFIDICQQLLPQHQPRNSSDRLTATVSDEDLTILIPNITTNFQIVDANFEPPTKEPQTYRHNVSDESMGLSKSLPEWMEEKEIILFSELISRCLTAGSLFNNTLVSLSMPVDGIVDSDTNEPQTAFVSGVLTLVGGGYGLDSARIDDNFITTICRDALPIELVESIRKIGGMYLPHTRTLHKMVLDDIINSYGYELQCSRVTHSGRPRI